MSQEENSLPRFEVRGTSDSHFSWLRTRLSVDRTMMAWIRTATALIGFGFTIVQFFERFGGMEGVATASRPQAPWYLGLALIGAGVFALALSIWQYTRVVDYLWSPAYRSLAGVAERQRMHTATLSLAILVALIGVFAFVAILTRLA
jgi:putative membrane protein